MPKFKVTWEFEDGYAGGSRPQYTRVNTEDEFEDDEWNKMSETDKKNWIEKQIEEDYFNRCSFYISDYGI
jgi:hypothetical protein